MNPSAKKKRPTNNNKPKKNVILVQTKKSATEKRTETLNDKLIEKFQYDIRGPFSHVMDLQSRVVNPTIPISVYSSAQAFAGFMIGVVSFAFCRGWTLNDLDDNYPYWAWVYQTNYLINIAKGGTLKTGNVPLWMNLITQAIIKTTARYRAGQVSYQFDITDTFDDNWMQGIGPTNVATKWLNGVQSTSANVNGFPVIDQPLPYTEENGFMATQNMWLFLQKIGHPMCEMVPSNKVNCMTRDVSAFAFFDIGPGDGYADTGGWFKQVYNEIDPSRPIFSCFAVPPKKGILVNRAKVKLKLFSGDAIMLGGMLTGGLKVNNLTVKTPPVIKYVDFLEIADVYCRVIQKAISLRTQQSFFATEIANNPNYYDQNLQCPLTLQEFLLLLRATCMLILTDNYCLQGTYPRVPASSNVNEFVVYPVGSNTYPVYFGNAMLIPKMLQENLLALRSRWVAHGKLGNKNPVMYKSCLGQYSKDSLVLEDYDVTYTVEGVDVTANAFFVESSEVPISLIDGASTLGTTPAYVAINNTGKLFELTNTFNKWIQSMGNTIRSVNPCTTDGGISALSVVHSTSHWLDMGSPNSTLPWKRGKNSSKIKRDSSEIKRNKEYEASLVRRNLVSLSTVYSSRKSIAISVGYEVVDAVWTQFQQYFVFPTNNVANPTTQGNNTSYLEMSAYFREPFQISLGSSSGGFSSLSAKHENFANMMIKSPFAAESAQDKALEQMDKQGTGGILGTVVAGLAGAVGHAAVDAGASLLGEVIPL
jgi:hypothetical protein